MAQRLVSLTTARTPAGCTRSTVRTRRSLLDMDAMKILQEQNRCSKDEQSGFVWILNTSVLIIPNYAFDLVKTE